VARVRVRRVAARSAAAVAAENAAEGCVRETYGALVASWQAAHAKDAELARAFERIARDEARHAALSWAVATWLEPRLGARERRRVDRARARALRILEAQVASPPAASLVRDAGLPTARHASALVRALADALDLKPSGQSAIDDLRGAQRHRHDRHLRVHAERRRHRAAVRDE
jgi:hypothetical protein